jgi:hypothetical protein
MIREITIPFSPPSLSNPLPVKRFLPSLPHSLAGKGLNQRQLFALLVSLYYVIIIIIVIIITSW